MAVNPSYGITLSLQDQSDEQTRFTANTPAFVDVSAGVPTILDDFISALQTANGGNPLVSWDDTHVLRVNSSGNRKVASNVRFPGNREDKLLFLMEDNTTLAPYGVTVPGRIGGLATSPGSDSLPPAVVTAMSATANALFASPDGNVGTLRDIVLVGRSS